MKVKIGKYKSWIGPYQLAEMLCFWVKPVKDEYGVYSKPEWVHKFGEWLSYGTVEEETKVGETRYLNKRRKTTLLHKTLVFLDGKKDRTVKVHIDPWDTWSMDDTLAHIILPMLKQLKETKHGSPYVDSEDVPESIRPPKGQEDAWKNGDTDEFHHQRWEWVLDEMIFAFANKLDDSWQDQFSSGEPNFGFKKLENGMSEMVTSRSYKIDWEGRKAYQARISNGFRLFGKYYESLWD